AAVPAVDVIARGSQVNVLRQADRVREGVGRRADLDRPQAAGRWLRARGGNVRGRDSRGGGIHRLEQVEPAAGDGLALEVGDGIDIVEDQRLDLGVTQVGVTGQDQGGGAGDVSGRECSIVERAVVSASNVDRPDAGTWRTQVHTGPAIVGMAPQ